MYDVIIIGAGPGGMSAALYASRAGLKTLIIEKSWLPGGQMNNTETIDNYIGAKTEDSFQLAKNMFEQIEDNVELRYGNEVNNIYYNEDEKLFYLSTNKKEEYKSYVVIVATGTQYKTLNVLEKYKNVSYCAVCDFPFYKNKNVAVIGGGDSALEAALLLSENSKQVFLIHRRDKYRAKSHLIKAIKNKKNIVEMLECVVVGRILDDHDIATHLYVDNMFLNEIVEINVEGIFPEIGNIPNSEMLNSKLVIKNEAKEIVASKNKQLFVIGDVTSQKHKQVAIAVAEGAKAGLEAYDVITELKN